jgi:diguanylate cyclase (GGDEF)-like protein/PAS domain S-box-containing protein
VEKQTDTKRFQTYITLVSIFGLGICVFLLFKLPFSEITLELLVIAATMLIGGSRITISIKYTRTSISVSDVFTFLVYFLYGIAPAVILSSAEAYFSSGRFTISRSLRVFNAGVLALSFFVSFNVSQALFGRIQDFSKDGLTSNAILIFISAVVCHYFINSFLISYCSAIRSKEPFLDIWKANYIWMIVPFAASGAFALVSAFMIRQLGFASFMLALPVVGILYFTYRSHQGKLDAMTMQTLQTETHLLEMKGSEERFRSAFSNAPIGIGLMSPEGRLLQVNDALCKIFGFSEEEILAKTLHEVVLPEDIVNFLTQIGFVIQRERKSFQTELRFFNHKGEKIWTQTSISRLNESENSRLICQIQDITARHNAEEKLRYDACFDSLTNLSNRAVFMDQLKNAIERAKSEKERQFAVVFVDLDKFKLINDSAGHAVGDQLLIAVSKRLTKCLPAQTTIARFGSDEFLILLDQDLREEKLGLLVEEIQKQVNLLYAIAGQEICVTSSIGVVYYDETHLTTEDVLRDADTALHIAKKQGRSRSVFFDEKMRENARSQMRLEKDLYRAVERRELALVYQPIVALAQKTVVGFEALVRWNHPQLGLVSPLDFISIAEENGAIINIGKFVLDEACKQLKIWQSTISDDLPLTISINVSAKQLLHKRFLHDVLEIFEKYDIEPKRVKLEITESVVVDYSDIVVSVLKQLRAMGVKLSMDDFGTGYSSLSYLHKLPINTLKIDRSFVSGMSTVAESAEIVKTIVLLAKNLNLDIVAEGIETLQQYQALRDLDCEFGQGYYFAKPLGIHEATELLRESFSHLNKSFGENIPQQSSLFFEN